MSRTTAIASLLIGMFLFMGSCVPIGYVIYYEAAIDPSESVSLSGSSDEFTFQVSPNTLARFKVEANLFKKIRIVFLMNMMRVLNFPLAIQ